MVAILIYLPRAPGQINFKRKFGLVVTKMRRACDNPKTIDRNPFTWFQKQGKLPISQFAFYGILGICYNLAFVLHPCPHDSNYPDLWNINYYSEKRKDLFPLFTPSFTPNRY